MKLIVYTDGASRGNPGHASIGFTISSEQGLLVEVGEYIGIATNNVAEYKAVIKALEKIKEELYENIPLDIELFADSKLVAEQLSGNYKVKSPHLKPLVEEVKILAKTLGTIRFTHIPRSKNTEADRLANQALDRR